MWHSYGTWTYTQHAHGIHSMHLGMRLTYIPMFLGQTCISEARTCIRGVYICQTYNMLTCTALPRSYPTLHGMLRVPCTSPMQYPHYCDSWECRPVPPSSSTASSVPTCHFDCQGGFTWRLRQQQCSHQSRLYIFQGTTWGLLPNIFRARVRALLPHVFHPHPVL